MKFLSTTRCRASQACVGIMAQSSPIVKFPALNVKRFSSGITSAWLRSPYIPYHTGFFARPRNFRTFWNTFCRNHRVSHHWHDILSADFDAAKAGRTWICVDTKRILFSGKRRKVKISLMRRPSVQGARGGVSNAQGRCGQAYCI